MKPNILLIMSDQHHKRRLGCAGDGLAHTPHLDALAARGTRFENAYCPFPLSGPSRMAFMTARWPHRTDCVTNLSELSSDFPTFAHAFHASGYETILSGRMHFVGFDQRHGFERRIIGDVSTTAFIKGGWGLKPILGDLTDTPGPSRPALIKSGPGRTGYHAYDEAVAETTAAWLRERGKRKGDPDARPFMLVMGLVSPHAPFVAPPEDFYRYWDQLTEADLPDARLETLHPVNAVLHARCGLEPWPDAEARRRVHAAYYGLVTFTDRCVGRALDALHEAGLEQDTLVVYTSDHGDQLGEHGLWWKHTFYEGSAGVPLLCAGQGVQGGATVKQSVNLIDVGPTLLNLAGAQTLPGASGRSFSKLLRGDASSWADETFCEHMGWGHAQPQRMVRCGPWKLNYYHGDEPELFNLDDDPGEFENQAGNPAFREVRATLLARVFDGWDPEALSLRFADYRERERLLETWYKDIRQPEPDPPWFATPPVNAIEPVRPPHKRM